MTDLCLVRISAGTSASLIEAFRGLSRSRRVRRLDKGGFLPNPVQFINRPTIRRYIV
jgi:hypothetical protein